MNTNPHPQSPAAFRAKAELEANFTRLPANYPQVPLIPAVEFKTFLKEFFTHQGISPNSALIIESHKTAPLITDHSALGTQNLINHIQSTTPKSTRNRRRTSRIPGEILANDRAARFLTYSAIAAAILILLTILTVLSI